MRQMEEIATVLESRNYSINNIICDTMKKFNFKTLCHRSGVKKADGYSAIDVLTLLIMLPLMALKNVHQLYKSEYGKRTVMQKDALYRLKNNERYPWRTLLYAVAKMFKKLTNPEDRPAEGVTAFIIDDTTDQRTGYKIENISYVFNHVLQKSVYGFKILVLTLFDGKSNIPLDFTIHTERELERKKAKTQYKEAVNPKCNGAKRRKEAKTSKIEQTLKMIKRAVKNGFSADYVLSDSWFTSLDFNKTIRSIKGGAMHIIAGIRNDKRQYTYKDQLFCAKEIIAQLMATGSAHRCRKWNVRYYEAVLHYEGVGDVKLFMCRYPHQKKWRIFITTNISLGFVETMKIYGIRWTIEVLFREAKQYLQLGSCQSQDFDAQIASTTISLITYTFLSYLKRKYSYETMGELFRLTQQDICEKKLAEKLWSLFEELLTFMIEVIASNSTMEITQLKSQKNIGMSKKFSLPLCYLNRWILLISRLDPLFWSFVFVCFMR